jgi:transposase
MARISKLLDEQVLLTAKKELKKLNKYLYVSRKLQAVISAFSNGITDVAKIYNISRTTLTEWIKCVKRGDIEKLGAPKTRKRRSKLTDDHKAHLKTWIEANPNITMRELKIMLKDKMDIDLSLSSVHRIVRSLNFSYITPRPIHYKQNPALVEEFKKKSTPESQT